MFVYPTTRQTYDYATPIACEKNPKNIIELDPDTHDQDCYILVPEPNKRKRPLMFTTSQIKTTKWPNGITAQVAGIYSNADLDQFWNRIFFFQNTQFNTSSFRKTQLFVIPSFHPIHLMTMQIHLMKILRKHYVLDYRTNLST